MIVTTQAQLDRVLKHFMRHDAFVFDVETRIPDNAKKRKSGEPKPVSLEPRLNDVFWLSLATTGLAVAIPMGHPNGAKIGRRKRDLAPGQKSTTVRVDVFSPPPPQLTREQVAETLRPLFFSDKLKIGHNLVKFDLPSWDKYYGEYIPGPYEDTLVLQQKLDENWKQTGLGPLVWKHCGHRLSKEDTTRLHLLPFDEAARYSRLDAFYNWVLWKKLLGRIERDDVLYENVLFERDVSGALYRMMRAGMPVDDRRIPALGAELDEQMALLEAELFEAAGRKFNLNAAAEKGWFVFDVRGHKPVMFTPAKGEPSTASGHLERFEFDPLVRKIGQWSALAKLKGTYVNNFAGFAIRGRIHPDFSQTGTVTGRFSSSNPNAQAVPRPDKPMSKAVRDLFLAPPGYKFIVADYSQIELRIMAHFSKDPNMVRAFREGIDVHQMTADMLGCDRTTAKSGNFLIIYGGWISRLMATSGCSRKTAEAFFKNHQREYPKIWAWVDGQQRRVQSMNGVPYVETMLGHRRRLPLAKAKDRAVRSGALRQAVNAPIQGSAADIVKMAMVRVDEKIRDMDGIDMVLQIHDEIVLLAADELVQEAEAILREAMVGEDMQVLRVPLTASFSTCSRWSAAKS